MPQEYHVDPSCEVQVEYRVDLDSVVFFIYSPRGMNEELEGVSRIVGLQRPCGREREKKKKS